MFSAAVTTAPTMGVPVAELLTSPVKIALAVTVFGLPRTLVTTCFLLSPAWVHKVVIVINFRPVSGVPDGKVTMAPESSCATWI